MTSRKSYALVLIALALSITVIGVTTSWGNSSKLALGVVYYYNQDSTDVIVAQLQQMKADGFQIVCIPFYWDPNPSDTISIQTSVLLETAQQLRLQVYVRQPYSTQDLQQYLTTYGTEIKYVEAMNEADAQLIASWSVPSEIESQAWQNAKTVKQYSSSIQTVASFATPLIGNMIYDIAQHVNIIALDVYDPMTLDAFSVELQPILSFSGKSTIWIGEFGYATLDDQAQANFLIQGLNTFQKNGVSTVIIWSWNDAGVGFNIQGRLAEKVIATWIGGS